MKQILAAALIAIVAFFGGITYVFHAETWLDTETNTFCMVLFDNVYEWDVSEG